MGNQKFYHGFNAGEIWDHKIDAIKYFLIHLVKKYQAPHVEFSYKSAASHTTGRQAETGKAG